MIHFKNLVNKQKTEKWYDVLSLYNTNQPSGSYGSIRIGIQINVMNKEKENNNNNNNKLHY